MNIHRMEYEEEIDYMYEHLIRLAKDNTIEVYKCYAYPYWCQWLRVTEVKTVIQSGTRIVMLPDDILNRIEHVCEGYLSWVDGVY